MADIRVTTTPVSRTPTPSGFQGQVGVRLNTFGMSKLEIGVNGEALAEITLDALQPSLQEALGNWPVLTGASRDSLSTDIIEIGPRMARAVLQVGGEKLINDSRNKSHRDYAPYIEFNGTATAPPGIIFSAVEGRRDEIRAEIHSKVSELIRSLLT